VFGEGKKAVLIRDYFSLTNKNNLLVKGKETLGPLLSCLHTSCIVSFNVSFFCSRSYAIP
jgi:hypothetical protein